MPSYAPCVACNVRGLLRDAETFAMTRWMVFIMRICLYRVDLTGRKPKMR